MTTEPNETLARPGAGQLIAFHSRTDRPNGQFPFIVLEEWRSATPTTRERAMMWFINTITDKPGWHTKVFDETIVAKWQAELREFQATGQQPLNRGFSDPMWDWCIRELRDKAELYGKYPAVAVIDMSGTVIKSDEVVTADIKDALKAAVKKLEDVPDKDKDWHPGSDDKVLDLVHPSLWPLVYGRTRILSDREIGINDALDTYGSGTTVPEPDVSKEAIAACGHDVNYEPNSHESRTLSLKFQWLPAEVEQTPNGPKFVSYINNLHPTEHREMYVVLERLLGKALPMLAATHDYTLVWADCDATPKDRQRIYSDTSNRVCTAKDVCKRYCSSYNRPKRLRDPNKPREVPNPVENEDEDEEGEDDDEGEDEDSDEDEEDDGETKDKLAKDAPQDGKSQEDDEHNDDDGDDDDKDDGDDDEVASVNDSDDIVSEADSVEYATSDMSDYSADERWYNETHPVSQPEPLPYKFFSYKDYKPNGPWFDGKRLQVIVKLANIHLTPDKPTYDGGSWHIEGQLNERICATALYYYDNENITDSRLAFQTPCDAEGFTEGEFEYEQGDWGGFEEQYDVHPDSDASTVMPMGDVLTREDRLITFPNVYQHQVQPFELIDKTKPGHRKIVAFFLVDPTTPVISTANVPPQQLHWGSLGIAGRLPAELSRLVMDELACPFDLETAKAIRTELIEERKAMDVQVDEQVNYEHWSFCEH